MENATMQEEKINVRGGINLLNVGSTMEIPRGIGDKPGRKPSYVRSVSSTIAADTGKKFTVNVDEETITVTRIK